MDKSAARKIAQVLNREEGRIARDAAVSFLACIRSDIPELAPAADFLGPSVLHPSHDSASSSTIEAREMLFAALERLSSVAVLALEVDEPGLVADDLRWLYRWLQARELIVPYDLMTETLFKCYLEACSAYLTPTDVDALQGLVTRSVQLLVSEPVES